MPTPDGSTRILVVCTANICRSPTAERALAAHLAAGGITAVELGSAGVHAIPGAPMCDLAAALSDHSLADLPAPAVEHRSRPLTKDLVTGSGLILTADRGHRGAVVESAPAVRNRVFTLRQGARLAEWVTDSGGVLAIAVARAAGSEVVLPPEDPRAAVPPLPDDPDARLEWLVEEMDAARGLAPVTESEPATPGWHHDDIGDPHVLGYQTHPQAVAATVAAAGTVARSMIRVLTGGRGSN